MKTLSELRNEARSLFNELNPSESHISQDQLNSWANEAYRYILSKIKNIPKKEGALTSALGDIDVSESTLTIDEAYILRATTGKYEQLEVVDLSILQEMNPQWLSADVGESKYLVRKDTFTYYLYPQPKTIGEAIKTYGMEFPANMSSDSDSPNKIPMNLVDSIPHFMAYRAFAQLNKPNESGQEYQFFRSNVKDQREISTVGSNSNQGWKIADIDDTY